MDENDNPWSPAEYSKLAAFDGDWRDTWWNDAFLGLMAERWKLGDVRTLLDVGCGVGHWSQRLARFLPETARIVGVDLEPGFREQALERAARRGLEGRFEFCAGTARALPFEDDTFDCVTCQTVLMHVPDAAATLGEMVRVCRPGGLVAAVEPNNLVGALQMICGYPRLPWNDVERLLRFDHLCRAGKRALGEGDTAIGERLPGLLREVGLSEIQVYVNDQCASWLPPYDSQREQLDHEQLFRFFDAEVSLTGGPIDDSRRRFLAGGGAEADFAQSWELLMRVQRELRAAIENQSVSGSRGFLHYLASGRKPA